MHQKLLFAQTLSDVAAQCLFGLVSVKWAYCGREVANVFTPGSRAGHLLNWNQVAAIKLSRKQTKLCIVLCRFLATLFSLINGRVLSLPHHWDTLTLFFCFLMFFPSQSDQQDQAWYHQEGEQTAHTYCWAGKSSWERIFLHVQSLGH